MLKWAISRFVALWILILASLWLSLWLASSRATSGTIILTHNIFLDHYKRFVLIDIDTRVSFAFSPELDDNERIFAMILSPVQERLIMFGYLDDNSYGVRVTDLSGKDTIAPIALANTNVLADSVTLTHDGRRAIIPTGITNNRTEQFLLDVVSGDLERFTVEQTSQDPNIAWSPDDNTVASIRDDSNDISQIWLHDLATDSVIQLTDNDNSTYCPAWSPDGEIIAYLETFAGIDHLRYIAVGSNNGTNLIGGEWHMMTCPQWTSNGHHLMFIASDAITSETYLVLFDPFTGVETILFSVESNAGIAIWHH
ncbi:MAG: hypothetical protein AAFV93_19460 [Chloroflexota bacterium]